LFATAAVEEVKLPEVNLDLKIDSRNFEDGVGFIDVMGFKLKTARGDQWQNLWLRFACD
jgi:hypothetical protein